MAAAPPQRAAPSAAGSQNGPDLDMQAVEGIPRETLVALLKRKDKEAQATTAKLDKLEERYVKVVRNNKILMEDRTSFLRFCNELLPESDAVFEEAAAQELPVNCESLVRSLGTWRGAFEAAREDRRVFQQFADLAFPGDEAVAHLFVGPRLSAEAFDTLQHRWVALEDLHNQSIASINALAREQVMAKNRELEEVRFARRDAEQRAEDLREQLTKLAREKAQILTQRLQGGVQVDASLPSSNGGSGYPLQQEQGKELRESREAVDAAEHRERVSRESVDAAERREEELRSTLEDQKLEAKRLHSEVDRLREEGDRHRVNAMQLVQQKDEVMGRLQSRLHELEQEMTSDSFIQRYAETQANRDADTRNQQRQMQQMVSTLREIQRLLDMSISQEKVLKERIRELELSRDRQGQVSGDYLKHVVMKYIEYNQKGDLKAHALVPVLCTLLTFSPEERRIVERQSIPTGLLYLNQAVGEAATWLRGGDALPAQAAPGALQLASGEPESALLDGATAGEPPRPSIPVGD